MDNAHGVDVLDAAEELVEEELDVFAREGPAVINGSVEVHVHQLANHIALFCMGRWVGGWRKRRRALIEWRSG